MPKAPCIEKAEGTINNKKDSFLKRQELFQSFWNKHVAANNEDHSHDKGISPGIDTSEDQLKETQTEAIVPKKDSYFRRRKLFRSLWNVRSVIDSGIRKAKSRVIKTVRNEESDTDSPKHQRIKHLQSTCDKLLRTYSKPGTSYMTSMMMFTAPCKRRRVYRRRKRRRRKSKTAANTQKLDPGTQATAGSISKPARPCFIDKSTSYQDLDLIEIESRYANRPKEAKAKRKLLRKYSTKKKKKRRKKN